MMKNTLINIAQIIKNAPKTTGVVSVAVVALAISTSVAFAYGPERPTFTIQKPADHITFNSITNNPNYGDERNFTLVKDASNQAASGWKDTIAVEDGKEYLVRMYVHNNAAANLNLVAKNTRVSAIVPTGMATSHQIDGLLSADNATPQKIWDSVVMTSDKKFNIGYVNGSARYYNNKHAGEGVALPDSITTSAGALVGYETLDGNVPGCFEYSGIATYKVKVTTEKTPDFTVEKMVRLNGTTDWQKSVTAKPGQKVDYRIGYDNVGQKVQNNVIAKDTLPAGVIYTAGSTTLKNASNPKGAAAGSDAIVTDKGLNIGNYTPNSNAYAYFTATLPSNDKLEVCGLNTLRNSVTIETDNGAKTDTADVIVEKTDCTPVTTPVTELPKTGVGQVVGSILGVVLLALGVAYYLKSRNELKQKLAGHSDSDGIKLLTAKTETKPEDDKTTI